MEHAVEALAPTTPAELAEALRDAAAHGRTIALAGNSSKRRMAGPIEPADAAITTSALQRVIEYEPRDLTISVEAGLPWRELTRILAANRQMVPLDPPFADHATVGGVMASNSSGPRRRLYGTARDLVIGMRFATLEGKLVQSGGMVVKNVAGLDMAKLMIGSFGTLAAIAVVNFKLQPAPETERSFLLPFDSLSGAIGRAQPDPRQRAAARRHRSAEPGGRDGLRAARLAAGRPRRRQRGLGRSLRSRVGAHRRPPGGREPLPRDPLAGRGKLHTAVPATGTPMARLCALRVR